MERITEPQYEHMERINKSQYAHMERISESQYGHGEISLHLSLTTWRKLLNLSMSMKRNTESQTGHVENR